jgi:MFS family permease
MVDGGGSSPPAAPGAPAPGRAARRSAIPGEGMSSTWAPLRLRLFRWVWIATLVSNIGTWMQTVGAQWLLVGHAHASALVALVQTATTLPVLLLALPAGVLADVVDRRRLLIASQAFQTAVAAAMALLAAAHRLSPTVLLGLTFALGCGATFSLPAQQAIIPELVPREDLAAASALGGMNQNLARSIGPALAGAVVARFGAGTVFTLNAVSFLLFVVVLAGWRRPARDVGDEPERLLSALRAGVRYIRHSPVTRRILFCTGAFVVPASALWALLPVVASRRLGLGAGGYGVLLAALGVGAVCGALLLRRLRARLTDHRVVTGAFVVYAGALVVAGAVRNTVVVAAAMVPAGLAWIAVLALVNASLQLFLPNWVRARGLSVYQMVLFGGLAVASAAWGAIAGGLGLVWAFVVAAAVMALSAAAVWKWPLADVAHLDRSPALWWPEPHLVLEPAPADGPVMVSLTYRVAPERVDVFLESMERVRRSRRRTGATRWELFQDGEDPRIFVEQYLVASWGEHLRQHSGRLTASDREFEEEAIGLTEGPPVIAHLFPPGLEAASTVDEDRPPDLS